MNDDRFNDLAIINIHIKTSYETEKPTKVLKAFINKIPVELN